MSMSQMEIQLTAVIVAAACALPGVYLVLRRMALISDAISHSILLGIVVAFFAVHDLASPILVFGAALTGVVTVVLVELLKKSGLVAEDAAIGLVFPLLFSFGVILISKYSGDVHLDIDSVLLGELAFVPFDRLQMWGIDFGPKALAVMAGILVLNLAFILLFYKELKISTFDAGLAASLGLSPVVFFYALMSLTSLTAVGAFDAVGSILVVALMIAPPAAAYLLTDRLSIMLVLAVVFGVVSAISGYWLAYFLDASIAGCMATMTGVVFALSFVFAPNRGLVSIILRLRGQGVKFAVMMLAIHLLNHEETGDADVENRIDTLEQHVAWDRRLIDRAVARLERNGLARTDGNLLVLTDDGRRYASEAMLNI